MNHPHTSLTSFPHLNQANDTEAIELDFATAWDDPDYNYADLNVNMDNVAPKERGAKWWRAAHKAYEDYRDNYVLVRTRIAAMYAMPAWQRSTEQWRRDRDALQGRWNRMHTGRWNTLNGVDPAIYFNTPRPTLANFYELGTQKLRVEWRRHGREAVPDAITLAAQGFQSNARQQALAGGPGQFQEYAGHALINQEAPGTGNFAHIPPYPQPPA